MTNPTIAARAGLTQLRKLAWTGLLLIVASATAAMVSQAAGADPGAETRIANLSNKLIDVMKNSKQLGYRGRYEALSPVLRESYNFNLMSQLSIGRRNWAKLSEDQRKRFQDLFTRMSISTYAARFKGYSGQSFEIVGQRSYGSGDVLVQSRLNNPDGDDVDLNYRMRKFGSGWKIFDVYLGGRVSELAKNHAEFTAVLRDKGFDGLVAAIEDMIRRNERNGAS